MLDFGNGLEGQLESLDEDGKITYETYSLHFC